jgi:hypothetical protein
MPATAPLLSGLNLDKAHGVDSTRIRAFGHDLGYETGATPCGTFSVFHDLLKRVPWSAFERLVDEHGADKHVRRLSTESQFVALLYGQLAGAVSLREIVGGLESHSSRLYHVGAKPASRSTLADANRLRPSAVFAGLFAQMVAGAGRGLRRAVIASGVVTCYDVLCFGSANYFRAAGYDQD